jgi:hypothetical protein
MPPFDPWFDLAPSFWNNAKAELPDTTVQSVLVAPVDDNEFRLAVIETAAEARLGKVIYAESVASSAFPCRFQNDRNTRFRNSSHH